MRRREALTATALACAGCAAPAAAGPLRALTADDFRAAGQRGVGIGLLRFGNRAEADHDAAAALGVRHLRAFIEVERTAAGDGYRVDPAQLGALDAMLASAERRGMYVLPVASFGADARHELWRNARLQSSAVDVWRDIARRFRGRAAIAGFDLVNEPVPPGLTYAMRQDRWLDFATRLIDAVRAADPQRVLIVESAPDAIGETFVNLRPLPYANLVYSVHSYAPYPFTHQGVAAEHPQPRPYPELGADGRSSATALVDSLRAVADFARRHDAPIYVGEFSAPRWAPGGSAARYVADSIALFNAQGWSWAYHEFRAWHGWDAEIAATDLPARHRSTDAPVLQALRAGLRAGRT